MGNCQSYHRQLYWILGSVNPSLVSRISALNAYCDFDLIPLKSRRELWGRVSWPRLFANVAPKPGICDIHKTGRRETMCKIIHTWAQLLNIWSINLSILDQRAVRNAGLLPVTGIATLPGPLNLPSTWWRLFTLLLVESCDSCSTSRARFNPLWRVSLAFSKTDSTIDSRFPKLWNTCRAVPTYVQENGLKYCHDNIL